MSKINATKEEVTAIIDSAISILNRFPDLESSNSTLSYGTSVNPFTLLMDLFKSTSGYNNLIKIIAKFISKSLPAVESAVKTLLTAKLKDIISCSVNPFLTDEILRNGVIFNIKEIDLVNTFRYSPFDEEIGQYYYFGVFENETYVDEDTGQTKERSVPILPDDLIKCDDMNALLWYMINRANKRYVWKPEKYRHGDEFRPDYPFNSGGYNFETDRKITDEDDEEMAAFEAECARLLQQEHERRPSVDEIADRVDLPHDKIEDALKVGTRHVSVDAPFSEGDENSLLDVLPNPDTPMADNELVAESLRDEIKRALQSLNERERNIIEAFFGIDQPEMTLEEIGEKFGLTRERVRQIKEKAIRRLRHNTKNKTLKSYLGQ